MYIALLGLPVACGTYMDPRLEQEADVLIQGKVTGGHEVSPRELREYVAKALRRTRKIGGYCCTIYKRERVNGELLGTQKARLELRHVPFSVHIRFLEPSSVAGEEAIYVEGRYDNKIVAHSTGILGWLGTVHLDPSGSMAMKGNRYPITDAGLMRLLEKLDAICRSKTIESCSVRMQEGVILDGRPCDLLELVQHPPAPVPGFSRIQALFDREFGVLVHYEVHAIDAMRRDVLIESHTFTDLRLDPGLTDQDFDPENPAYDY